MAKNILILGGLGFIGFYLAEKLSKDKKNKITLVDDNSRGQLDAEAKKLISKKNVQFKKLNLTKNSSYKKLSSNKVFNHVYLLASIVGVNNTLTNPDKVIEVNTQIILNTFQWLKVSKVKKFMFTSTSEAYAGTIDKFGFKIPTPESVPLTINKIDHPRFTYAVTKILGESAFLNLKKNQLSSVVVRFHNVYGPRMGFKHVIPHLIERFYNKENPFMIYGAEQTRSFCYIDDAISMMIKIMSSKKNLYKIYNIGNSKEVSIKGLTKKVGRLFKYKGIYKNSVAFPGSTKRRCPDISRIKNEFNFISRTNLEQGLKKTIKWYLKFFEKNNELFEKSFQKPSDFKNV